MKSEYKRDMNHNFFILYGEEEVDTGSYQVRMLVGNAIPSLLKCRIQGIDGKFMVYYDITSKQSVSSLYEQKKFSMEDLRLIFGAFVQVMEEMSEYLLNPGQLVIRPEYIFLDVEKKQMFFCCLPGFDRDVRVQFQELTEYILPQLDHEDEKAIILGYGVYRRAMEDSFHLEHIKEELYQVREMKEGHSKTRREFQADTGDEAASLEEGENMEETSEVEDTFFWREDTTPKYSEKADGNYCKDDQTTGIGKKILWCIAGAAVIIGMLAAKIMGFMPGMKAEVILGLVMIVMGMGMLGYKVYKHVKKNDTVPPDKGIQRKKCSLSESAGRDKTALKRNGIQKNRETRTKQAASGTEKSRLRTSADDCQKDLENNFGEEKALFGIQRKTDEKRERYTHEEDYGETVVLSASPAAGPASLVSREPGELATIYLQEEMTVIGKLEIAADAVINLPTVSRVHAKIRKREGEYYLSDLNSRNGTSVNGRMLKGEEEYQLQDQDEVDFAQARYVFLK